jgi:hypothetical protein
LQKRLLDAEFDGSQDWLVAILAAALRVLDAAELQAFKQAGLG